MNRRSVTRALSSLAVLIFAALFSAQPAMPRSAAAPRTTPRRHRSLRHRIAASSRVNTRAATRTTSQAAVIHRSTSRSLRVTYLRRRGRRQRVFFNPWTEPTYADSTLGDNVDGEDLVIRKAAMDALGPYNGTVVVTNPDTGRILSIVNQKLATKGAYQPCSTVKMMVSLASLREGIVDPATQLRISRRFSMDMTQALARSNNLYFAKLGEQLGFDRVEKYGKLFGLGEKAGLDIPGEEAGYLTDQAPATGVGMMTSFGDGIRLTPLELASIVSSIANGGTMYYLQYPRSQEEVDKFVPRIKRDLEIANLIPEVRAGMMGAVEYGTARRAGYSNDESLYGKTGTCTDTAQPGVHLGWFGSFHDDGKHKLAVVVLLTGGRGVSGPIASGIAGNFYRNLAQQNYFLNNQPTAPPIALVSMQDFAQ